MKTLFRTIVSLIVISSLLTGCAGPALPSLAGKINPGQPKNLLPVKSGQSQTPADQPAADPGPGSSLPALSNTPTQDLNPKPAAPRMKTGAPAPEPAQAKPLAAEQPAILLFGVGMHIEPFGAVTSVLAGDPAPAGKQQPNYNNSQFFAFHVQDIRTIAAMVERYGGRMTIQAQTPFTQIAIDNRNPVLSDLAQAGHEIALHFHEDSHLGPQVNELPVDTWCAVMKEEITLVKQAAGIDQVRFWSGGNLYGQLFEAAACAGLDVNGDWKNPQTQNIPAEMTGIHPWRPAGGAPGGDTTLAARHDPTGPVIYLPSGMLPPNVTPVKPARASSDEAYFEYLKNSLLASVAAAQPGQANVFHITLHPGEFRGDPQHPFEVIERFLAEVVDPLVKAGQVRWATLDRKSVV